MTELLLRYNNIFPFDIFSGRGSQEIAIPLAVATSVVIPLVVTVCAISILLLMYRRKGRMRKPVECEGDVEMEPDDDCNIDPDSPEINPSASYISNSDHDGISFHEDAVHELSAGLKNSQEAIV